MENGMVKKKKSQLHLMKKSLMTFAIIVLGATTVFSQTPIIPEFGDGSEENPYQIATLQNLHWITDDNSRLGYHYVQTADVDASTTAGWYGGAGFPPIGASWIDSFTGSYNGQGHTIDGIHIKRETAMFVGLFGSVVNAKIEWLGVTNVDMAGHDHVGGLVGKIQSEYTLSNCFTTGSVTGNSRVGGLVGDHYYSSISDCYSTCSVTFGDTSSSGHWSGGGLVGYGFRSAIKNSYATGSVKGIPSAGGLVGQSIYVAVESSFWDTQTSGQSSGDGGFGKTTNEMKDVETFTKISFYVPSPWDFVNNPFDDVANENFWDIDNAGVINKGYPYLIYDFNSAVENIPVEKQEFDIYPNPAISVINLHSALFIQQASDVEIYDLNGRQLFEKHILKGTESIELDVSHLPSGVYGCKLSTENNSVTKKLIIK